jgi:diphthine-ammonia ligase
MQKNEEINRMPKVVAFSSGGKDSMYALYLALNNEINVDYLLFVKNGSKAHRLNSWLLELVSETLEIPAVTTDKDMPAIRKTLQKLKADMIISGVMITPEHMDWYHEICEPIQVEHYAPLWGKKPLVELTEIENLGFQTIIIEVDASMGSSKNWIGKKIEKPIIQEMEKLEKEQKINSSGELGAYHTFVLDCPLYKKKINILDSEIFAENSKRYFVIKNASLQSKISPKHEPVL